MKYGIKEESFNEIEVKKSRFLAYIFPIFSIDEFKNKLEIINKEHYKAKHACYAYIIGNNKRGYDDGEPKGTAGLPLLNLLINNNLENVGLIVVRYFGGTLLGASNLARTYLKSGEEVLAISKRVELIEMINYEIEVSYDLYDIVLNYLNSNHFNILNTSFNDKIIISFLTDLTFNEKEFLSRFLLKIKVISKMNYLYKKDIK